LIVLDASVAVSWLLNENLRPDLDTILVTNRVIVPSHWTVEVGHAILKALRRKAIIHEHLIGIASDLDSLNISIQPPTPVASMLPLLAFAREHGLTMYDAAYVQLALNRSAQLATLDSAMSTTAARLGIKLAVG
jgi:predicted nucleic acid-binding protein